MEWAEQMKVGRSFCRVCREDEIDEVLELCSPAAE